MGKKKIVVFTASVLLFCTVGFSNILDLDFSGVDGSENHDEATFELTAMDSADANLNLVEGLNFKAPSTVQSTGGASYDTSYDLNVIGWGGASDLLNYVKGDRYLSITIQADAGYKLNLDGATISLLGSRNGSGAPDIFYITATTTGTTGTSNQIGGSTSLPLTGPSNVYDIQATFSGAEWNGLTGEVEIRFYGGGNTETGNIHFSDMSITGGSVTPIPPGEISITSFHASPTNLFSGEKTMLSWATFGADSLSIDQGIGEVTGLTSTQVVVLADTTYTLTATNTFGNTTNTSVEVATTALPATLPNIVLIVADDVGFGDLSCYGAPSIHTPNLDKLARQGSRFTQFTTCGPGDLANQYAWLTGRVARRGNLPASLDSGETGGLDSREWTLGEALRKTGYETAFIGAWHLGDLAGNIATDQGFQLFFGLPYRPDAVPAPPLMENGTTVDAEYVPSTLLTQLTERAESFIADQGEAPFLLIFQPPALPATGSSLEGAYGNSVEALDHSVGELLDALESAGQTTNTLVVFCSDEGPDLTSSSYPFGSSGLFRDGKSTTWEGGVRVPAIASWPGVIPPATDNYAVFWLPDLFSSLVHIAGAYAPADRPYDGTSRLAALLATQTQPDEETTLFLHRHNGSGYQLQGVRKGAFKYHLSYQNSDPQNSFSTAAPLLFHVEIDPTEHVNRSSDSGYQTTLSNLQAEAASYEETFIPPQLPPARGAFIDPPPSLWIGDDAGDHAFISSIVRPQDSLNDHYHIQHTTNLILSVWDNLPIQDYILSITLQPVEEEVLEISVPFDDPEFSGPNNFIRISGERP